MLALARKKKLANVSRNIVLQFCPYLRLILKDIDK